MSKKEELNPEPYEIVYECEICYEETLNDDCVCDSCLHHKVGA